MKVDKEKCIGCRLCETLSENFRMKDGKAEYILIEENNSNRDKEAKDNCPSEAILEEEND